MPDIGAPRDRPRRAGSKIQAAMFPRDPAGAELLFEFLFVAMRRQISGRRERLCLADPGGKRRCR
jgi:hypothetical protein